MMSVSADVRCNIDIRCGKYILYYILLNIVNLDDYLYITFYNILHIFINIFTNTFLYLYIFDRSREESILVF